MAVIVGQIEPLKKIREALNDKGITRFKSIGDINAFLRNFDSEMKAVPKTVGDILDEEIANLKSEHIRLQLNYEKTRELVRENVIQESKVIENKLAYLKDKSTRSAILKAVNYLRIRFLSTKLLRLEKEIDNITHKGSIVAEYDASMAKKKHEDILLNRTEILGKRCDDSYANLKYVKDVIDGLYPIIAGAMGENSVVNEIKKMPDGHYLINNFNLEFDPPIYNKSNQDRIFSIQIDHLLVCRSGVFSIETKNWSEKSINNFDLRSPVEQVLRSGFALYVLVHDGLNNDNIELSRHHWGSKKIPIRNVIVMTNKKPKGEFKHVKVLSLKELNGYINYFDPIFNMEETEEIFKYLNNLNAK
jgi:Nuclease-related domain